MATGPGWDRRGRLAPGTIAGERAASCTGAAPDVQAPFFSILYEKLANVAVFSLGAISLPSQNVDGFLPAHLPLFRAWARTQPSSSPSGGTPPSHWLERDHVPTWACALGPPVQSGAFPSFFVRRLSSVLLCDSTAATARYYPLEPCIYRGVDWNPCIAPHSRTAWQSDRTRLTRLPASATLQMVRISVLNDALKSIYNAEKRGKKQVGRRDCLDGVAPQGEGSCCSNSSHLPSAPGADPPRLEGCDQVPARDAEAR